MKQVSVCLVVLLTFLMTGCGPSQTEYDSIKRENESLKIEISNLKKEIEELRFGSSRLLAQGVKYFEDGKFELAKNTFETLLNKHPSSNEAKDAKTYIDRANLELKKLKELEASKREREEQEKKARIANATKRMSKKYDELEGITWYTDSSTHAFHTSFHLYFGQRKSDTPWLRLKIRYYADDWLFIDSFFVVADGQRFEKPLAKFERDHGSGSIWEWYDENVSVSDMAMIKAIIRSKKATIRFTGNQYHKDHVITAQEKKSLQNVIDAFEALGGKI